MCRFSGTDSGQGSNDIQRNFEKGICTLVLVEILQDKRVGDQIGNAVRIDLRVRIRRKLRIAKLGVLACFVEVAGKHGKTGNHT